jgi:1,4-alpha-glucan branching enzyme
MGWMHDTLAYFQKEPIYRRHHHGQLTFGLLYAFSENFMLPLSHDEVVHGKGSLYGKMPGDPWQKRANLRALFAWMWAHPGKKLLFMGSEFGQPKEWNHDKSLDWHLTDDPGHRGIMSLVRDLNRVYREHPALWELDAEPAGFRWLVVDDRDANVVAFARFSAQGRAVVAIANLSPVPRPSYRVPMPHAGHWREILNSDSDVYGGANLGNLGGVHADDTPWGGESASAEVLVPPLGVIWLTPDE